MSGIADWTQYFNETKGVAYNRRNAAIYTPIVNRYTSELNRFNDGSVAPPKIVREYTDREPVVPRPVLTFGNKEYEHVDSNPNFTPGGYFPWGAEKVLYYDLPHRDTRNITRQHPDGTREQIPLDILRNL